jgi:2-methylisocitrate lyase-like PEP mutase family enzyme
MLAGAHGYDSRCQAWMGKVPMFASTRLRESLRRGELIVAPGAHDCITARLVEQAGFGAVYMSGLGTAAMLGFPDYGLATLSEFAANAGRIVEAVTIPVIADADTGFGNELNVIRTVREYESRGVAAIQLEDQTFSKRCGHIDGKEVVHADEFIAKIRAASAARRVPDTLIIARSDAREVHGLDEAVNRLNRAFDAGADIGFIDATPTVEETARIPKLLTGPCMFNLVRGGKSPVLTLDELAEFGYAMVILPGLLLSEMVGACENVLAKTRLSKEHPVTSKDLLLRDLFSRFGTDAWDQLRQRFK